MQKKLAKIVGSRWFLVSGGVILGAVMVFGARFVTYKPDAVHYHANFAVYVNGEREEFKGPQYYTETAMCTLDKGMTPKERAHLHDNINNVVHVEDHAVTWGQLMANLGMSIGPSFIVSPDGTIYSENNANQLHFVLNGQDYTSLGASIVNAVIKDKDKLLISFGDVPQAKIQKQYSSIPNTAKDYDVAKDPESCGSHVNVGLRERIKHMF